MKQTPGKDLVDHCPHCGTYFEEPLAKAKVNYRSMPQHRRYFKAIREAFHHWPESHEEQFSNPEELRAWLQMKAGYFEVSAKIPLTGIRPELAKMLAESAIRACGSYAMPAVRGTHLFIYRPKSIRVEALSHLEFCALNRIVEDKIEEVLGVSVKELLFNAKKHGEASKTTELA